ncbi:hypothetical protein H0H93_014809 [Arthromyces matolae]|nr:hypothetical protein H0H93_014809 [Arthromyces matolae]
MTAISPSAAVANLHQIHSMRHSSESTLRSQPHSKPSSNHLSSRSIAFNSVYSDEDVESTQRQQEPEHEEVALDDYHEHFRALVSQITRETEEAIAHERRNAGPDSQSAEAFYQPRILPAIGYDEFGRPYPPDESVPILNGYIRRMPTIESMGSREMGSLTSSVYSQSDTMTTSVRSSLPLSRPPTRANTLDSNFGSRPPSRSNSITAGAEILLNASRASEVGELVDRSTLDTRGVSTASSGSSYPSTASYYTATNGSLSSGIPTPASH